MLDEFDFEVIHRPGKLNVVADALSRLNAVECGAESGGYHRENLFKGLEQAYKNDKETKKIIQNLDVHREFCVIQNKLYYTGKDRMQLYLPLGTFRDFIMQECHDTRYAGHLGLWKTEELISQDFYWPTIHADVTTYVQTCEECQRNKPSNQRPVGLFQPLEVPEQHWERISMDFITHLPRTRAGYNSLMVIVDYLTKMMILRPTHSIAMAVDTARIFMDAGVEATRSAQVIVSDRDTKFTSNFWRECLQGDGHYTGNVLGISSPD